MANRTKGKIIEQIFKLTGASPEKHSDHLLDKDIAYLEKLLIVVKSLK